MSPTEAAKILDLPVDATPEAIETRFNELRARLEDKVAKAPTPGLKAKYRESLDDITAAFESLTLAADASSLPVRSKQSAVSTPPPDHTAGGAHPPRAAVAAPAAKKSGGKEFVVVAALALVVLAGGGWFVMKTRSENETKARLAAEQKAEAERQAAAAKQQEEAEKARLAAAEKAKAVHLEQLGLKLRTRLSELNITLDATLKIESLAERELSDLKAEERSLQREAKSGPTPDLRAAQAALSAQDRYVAWLRDNLATSPARTSRAKLEELIAAKAWDEAAAVIDGYAAAIKQLQDDIAAKRADLLTLEGGLTVTAIPAELDFTLQDAYGRTRNGRTPAQLGDVPFGPTTVIFHREGWPDQARSAVVKRDTAASVSGDFVGGSLTLASKPFPADFVVTGQGRTERGRTPATLPELPVGTYQVVFQRAGWPDQAASAAITRSGNASAEGSFAPAGTLKVESVPAGASVTHQGRIVGTTPLTLSDLPPGATSVELALADYRPATLQGTIEPGKELTLTATLRSAALTPEEAFAKLSKDAQGTWVFPYHNPISGNQRLYLRFTPGSRTVSLEQTGFGGSTRNLTMVEYDPANRIVYIAFSGLDALNGKLGLRLEGDTLLYGRGKLDNPSVFHRE